MKASLCIKPLIIIAISTIVIFYSYLLYQYVNNPVINPPVATKDILHPIHTLPLDKLFSPPYRYRTNATLIKNPNCNNYIGSFRKDGFPARKKYNSALHLITLDNNFSIINDYVVKAPIIEKNSTIMYFPEDPRLIYVNNDLYLLYNATRNELKREHFIANIEVNDNDIHVISNICLQSPLDKKVDQKNWTPFTYNNDLYLIYKFEPHIIYKYDKITREVNVAYQNNNNLQSLWKLGEIRGGTPAIFVQELNAYLTFFHSSLPYRKLPIRSVNPHTPYSRIYYTGAVLFSARPPFNLLAYTPPLSFRGQYQTLDLYYNIIFPVGLVEQKNNFIISAGIQDTKSVLFRIDKQELYQEFIFL